MDTVLFELDSSESETLCQCGDKPDDKGWCKCGRLQVHSREAVEVLRELAEKRFSARDDLDSQS